MYDKLKLIIFTEGNFNSKSTFGAKSDSWATLIFDDNPIFANKQEGRETRPGASVIKLTFVIYKEF